MTMTQEAPTGLAAGIRAKQAGQAQALNAVGEWKDVAMATITEWAAENREFTAEDLVKEIGLPNKHSSGNENNAVGAVFSHAKRKGIIDWTGRIVQSEREENHASDLRVWSKAGIQRLNIEADIVRRLAALAGANLVLRADDLDPEFIEETEKMIARARLLLVASYQ